MLLPPSSVPPSQADGPYSPAANLAGPTILARTHSLNAIAGKHELDGQWLGSIVASDGNVYFGSSTHASHAAASFFKYSPTVGQVSLIAADISAVAGENAATQIPQGKLHSPIREHNGSLYMTTHLGNYWAGAHNAYTGAHALKYNIAGNSWSDFGVMQQRYTSYAGVSVDPVRNYLYASATAASSLDAGGRTKLFRFDLNHANPASTKTVVNMTVAGGSSVNQSSVGSEDFASDFAQFTDHNGHIWFTIGSNSAADNADLFRIRPPSTPGGASTIERYDNVLPQRYSVTADTMSGASQTSRRAFEWGESRNGGESFLFSMFSDGAIWEFDPDTFDANPTNRALAFVKKGWLGPHGHAKALGGDTLYYMQRADKARTNGGTLGNKGPDNHLLALDLETGEIIDYGRLVDELGRTPWRAEGMSADAFGNVYLTGDWRLRPEDYGTSAQTWRYDDAPDGADAGPNGDGNYYEMWRGQFFAAVTVPEPTTLLLGVPMLGCLLAQRRRR